MQCAADALHESGDLGPLAELDLHLLAPALQAQRVLVEHHGLGLGGVGALLQPVGRVVEHFAGGHHRLVEQREMAFFDKPGVAAGVTRQLGHELLDVKRGVAQCRVAEEHEAGEKSSNHVRCQKSKKLNQLYGARRHMSPSRSA
ncbi:hypothetical protein D9M68_858400 [compost metagenome]